MDFNSIPANAYGQELDFNPGLSEDPRDTAYCSYQQYSLPLQQDPYSSQQSAMLPQPWLPLQAATNNWSGFPPATDVAGLTYDNPFSSEVDAQAYAQRDDFSYAGCEDVEPIDRTHQNLGIYDASTVPPMPTDSVSGAQLFLVSFQDSLTSKANRRTFQIRDRTGQVRASEIKGKNRLREEWQKHTETTAVPSVRLVDAFATRSSTGSGWFLPHDKKWVVETVDQSGVLSRFNSMGDPVTVNTGPAEVNHGSLPQQAAQLGHTFSFATLLIQTERTSRDAGRGGKQPPWRHITSHTETPNDKVAYIGAPKLAAGLSDTMRGTMGGWGLFVGPEVSGPSQSTCIRFQKAAKEGDSTFEYGPGWWTLTAERSDGKWVWNSKDPKGTFVSTGQASI